MKQCFTQYLNLIWKALCFLGSQDASGSAKVGEKQSKYDRPGCPSAKTGGGKRRPFWHFFPPKIKCKSPYRCMNASF